MGEDGNKYMVDNEGAHTVARDEDTDIQGNVVVDRIHRDDGDDDMFHCTEDTVAGCKERTLEHVGVDTEGILVDLIHIRGTKE